VLYFNSFFDPLFTIRPLLLRALHLIPKRPVILAPRGEFSPGALAIKAWKKRAFLRTAITSLYQGLLWQASSERELELILQVMQEYTKKVLLTENIVVAPDVLPLFPDSVPKGSGFKAKGKLRVVFLSRISRMKNLDGALRSLAQVKAPVEFNIYGPLEDQTYWRQCQVLMEQLPPNVTSKYVGSVEHSRVHEVFARHHLFFFPTHGENFGHVIPESLAAGTPVLISDQTPWRGLVELGIGWDFPVSDSDRFAAIIDSVAAMDDYRYQQLRVNALRHASTGLANLEAIEKNRELFLNAARPVCRL
jgi:glycosyltransferase involved in cell wall biosynthesis